MYDCQSLPVVETGNTSTAILETTTSRSKPDIFVPISIVDKHKLCLNKRNLSKWNSTFL